LSDIFQGHPVSSLYDINNLPQSEKEAIYLKLIPPRLFTQFQIDPLSRQNQACERVINFYCPPGMGFVSLEVKRQLEDEDPIFTLDLETTNLYQLELSFVSFNNPLAERFQVDRDEEGRKNFLATGKRNLKEELRALKAGLAPGQVRKGLGLLRDFFVILENFLRAMRTEIFLLEPLFYHNAITYERFGCGYIEGKTFMERIHKGFLPGGDLFSRLDGSSPFRQIGFDKTIRGRSWAIHDSILLEPWRSPKMFKNIGQDLGISTFPNATY
jgi:hypothetical protein